MTGRRARFLDQAGRPLPGMCPQCLHRFASGAEIARHGSRWMHAHCAGEVCAASAAAVLAAELSRSIYAAAGHAPRANAATGNGNGARL